MFANLVSNADDALALFGQKRTANRKVRLAYRYLTLFIHVYIQGVTIPSQRRYVRYFQKIASLGNVLPPRQSMRLEGMHILSIPNVCPSFPSLVHFPCSQRRFFCRPTYQEAASHITSSTKTTCSASAQRLLTSSLFCILTFLISSFRLPKHLSQHTNAKHTHQ